MSEIQACGRRLPTFNVIDDFDRKARYIEVDTTSTITPPIYIFEQLRRDHDLPQMLRTDNGSEFLGGTFVQ